MGVSWGIARGIPCIIAPDGILSSPDRTLAPHIVSEIIEPGMRVRHPAQPDWGIGQVQSVVGDRITVNFEHAGKVLINAAVIALVVEDGPAQ
jgi:FKBP-type peptidyl-prolyl cis-trans isomerase 2